MLKAGAGVAYKIVVANRDEILSGSNPLPCRKFQSRAHVKQRYCCTYRRDQSGDTFQLMLHWYLILLFTQHRSLIHQNVPTTRAKVARAGNQAKLT